MKAMHKKMICTWMQIIISVDPLYIHYATQASIQQNSKNTYIINTVTIMPSAI